MIHQIQEGTKEAVLRHLKIMLIFQDLKLQNLHFTIKSLIWKMY